MVRSMTAFARGQVQLEPGVITWELRSLNARYLEVHMKLPEEWRPLEVKAREMIAGVLKRGKLECNFRFQRNSSEAPNLVLNEALAHKLGELSDRVAQMNLGATALSSIDVLRWPGMVVEEEQDWSSLHGAILDALQSTLDELLRMRESEGRRLCETILERCTQVSELSTRARALAPSIRSGLKQRLLKRLAELSMKVDDERMEQEIALQLQRLDVDEELDRLDSHIEEVRKTLARAEPVGRKLDFLMQELNREANTLGAKAASLDITEISVELKVLIEQMREQVQNIE